MLINLSVIDLMLIETLNSMIVGTKASCLINDHIQATGKSFSILLSRRVDLCMHTFGLLSGFLQQRYRL